MLYAIVTLSLIHICNLSQGIKEDGIAIGEARKEEKIILNMHNNGFTVEQIAMATDKNVEEVKAIIAEKEPCLLYTSLISQGPDRAAADGGGAAYAVTYEEMQEVLGTYTPD